MPATLIGSNSNLNSGNRNLSTTLAVTIGDLIVVGGGSFFASGGNPTGWSCSDSAGNAYNLGSYGSGGGGGQSACFYAYATTTGTITITISEDTARTDRYIIAANYQGAGVFDQCVAQIGEYNPSDPTLSPGFASGGFNLADTLVVTFAYVDISPLTVLTLHSETGEVEVRELVRMYMFQRMATGPGTSSVKLSVPASAGAGNVVTLSGMTFSNPLPRPGGTLSQYAVRPGQGFQAPPAPFFPVQNPLTATLPYVPLLGSLVVVACMPGNNIPPAVFINDTYGNTYTQLLISPGNGGGSNVVLFSAIVEHLPPNGEIFQVTFTQPGQSGFQVYQCTALAIAERVIGGTLGIVRSAAWLSDSSSNPTNTLTTETVNGVQSGDYLIAFGVYPGGSTQNSATWAALDGYTIQQQWSFIQFPHQLVNADYLGTIAIADKLAPSSGNYNARMSYTIDGDYAEGGSIALLTFSVITLLTLPCPLAAPGTVGMPFTETLIASGGTPPYTYAVVAGYSLPPGLTLDPATGIISGIPTTAGTFNIAFMVTDSLGTVATTMGTCPIPISGPPGAPCSNAVTNPALDSYLELRKVLVAWKKETHLPVRGKS